MAPAGASGRPLSPPLRFAGLAEAMKDPGPSPCTPCGAATWTCRSITRPGDGPVERSVLRHHDLLEATATGWTCARRAPRRCSPRNGTALARGALHARALAGLLALRVLAPDRAHGRGRAAQTPRLALWGHSRGPPPTTLPGITSSGGGFHPDPTRDRTGAPERGAGAGAGRSRLYGDGLVALAGRGPRGGCCHRPCSPG